MKKFKTLVYDNNFVDTNFHVLSKEIKASNIPTLYKENETLDSLINSAKLMENILGDKIITLNYYRNLIKCDLVDVTIDF